MPPNPFPRATNALSPEGRSRWQTESLAGHCSRLELGDKGTEFLNVRPVLDFESVSGSSDVADPARGCASGKSLGLTKSRGAARAVAATAQIKCDGPHLPVYEGELAAVRLDEASKEQVVVCGVEDIQMQ